MLHYTVTIDYNCDQKSHRQFYDCSNKRRDKVEFTTPRIVCAQKEMFINREEPIYWIIPCALIEVSPFIPDRSYL
jgi:hypothetical protein